jgi:hypothetical protein
MAASGRYMKTNNPKSNSGSKKKTKSRRVNTRDGLATITNRIAMVITQASNLFMCHLAQSYRFEPATTANNPRPTGV